MQNILKVGDEVTAYVKMIIFGGGMMKMNHIFTIKQLTDNHVYAMSIVDGSERVFPYSAINHINGMSVARYLKTIKKSRKWDR